MIVVVIGIGGMLWLIGCVVFYVELFVGVNMVMVDFVCLLISINVIIFVFDDLKYCGNLCIVFKLVDVMWLICVLVGVLIVLGVSFICVLGMFIYCCGVLVMFVL